MARARKPKIKVNVVRRSYYDWSTRTMIKDWVVEVTINACTRGGGQSNVILFEKSGFNTREDAREAARDFCSDLLMDLTSRVFKTPSCLR